MGIAVADKIRTSTNGRRRVFGIKKLNLFVFVLLIFFEFIFYIETTKLDV